MPTLSIIGCGNVGRTLGRVWTKNHLLKIETVFNRSQESAQRAVDFMGQGKAIGELGQLALSDLIMISVSDDAIAGCCQQLVASKALKPGTLVFHCSGSLPSSVLEPARRQGARVASLHPLRSFADPGRCAETFPGTPCGIEGGPSACETLAQLISDSGGLVFSLNAETKLFYHAGTVMLCNYLTTLVEAGLQCYEKAGITRQQGLDLVKPILKETLENNFKLSPVGALTGPISRGDAQLVRKQVEALNDWNPILSALYKAAGLVAVDLALRKGTAPKVALEEIKKNLTCLGSRRS